MVTFDMVVVGSGGGPDETNVSGFDDLSNYCMTGS